MIHVKTTWAPSQHTSDASFKPSPDPACSAAQKHKATATKSGEQISG